MVKRRTIVFDDETDKKVRELQTKMMKREEAHVSFSSVVVELTKLGLTDESLLVD